MFFSEVTNQAGTFFYLVPWAVFFPVIGLLINMAFGHKLGEKGVAAVAVTASALPLSSRCCCGFPCAFSLKAR